MTPLPEPEHNDHVDVRFKRHNCFTADQMRAYGAAEYKRALSEANVSRFADWMDEAADDIEFWGAYASDYFKKKHDLANYSLDYKSRAAVLRKLGETS